VHPLLVPPVVTQLFDGSSPLSRERLLALVEAARWAASAWNRQPWRFVLGRNGDPTFGTLRGSLTPRNRELVRNAGALILAAVRSRSPQGMELSGTTYELGLSVERLALQARATGWHTLQLGGFNRGLVSTALRVPPDFDPFVIVAVGRPAFDITRASPWREAARDRQALSDLAFGAQWGHPFAG
jgi:nitroreductase